LNDEDKIGRRRSAQPRDIYTVSRLNRETRGLLESEFGTIWIEGELSNLARPRSGHWYFSLKDSAAQSRCAMFKSRNNLVGFEPREGMQVLARARVGMYEPRGEFQLLVEHMELAGEGLLRIKFDQLKRKLATEGLFDTEVKQPLPQWPHRIGVVTSPSGAAIRDILTVLKRRNPAIEVIIYPTSVQGPSAAPEIVRAIDTANLRDDCDVLILGRGGGSIEDLWAFNEEIVARAVYRSTVPVVSAVGHEIDFTIADLVADVRAATPSASAEICSPDREQVLRSLETVNVRLSTAMSAQNRTLAGQLKNLETRLQHPGRRLEQYHQRIDELMQRLPNSVATGLQLRQSALTAMTARIRSCNPHHRIMHYRTRITDLQRRMKTSMGSNLSTMQARLTGKVRALRAISPQSTLQRGYAIVTAADGSIAREADAFAAGEQVRARLALGSLNLMVESVESSLNENPRDADTNE
jgi:exodeoxyribonuclease VII large subunit